MSLPGQWVSEASSQWGLKSGGRLHAPNLRNLVHVPITPAGPNPWQRSSFRRGTTTFPAIDTPPPRFGQANFYTPATARFVPGATPRPFSMGNPLPMGTEYVLRPQQPTTPNEIIKEPRVELSASLSSSQFEVGFFEKPGSPLRFRARNSVRAWGSSRMGLFTGEQNGMDMQVCLLRTHPALLCGRRVALLALRVSMQQHRSPYAETVRLVSQPQLQGVTQR